LAKTVQQWRNQSRPMAAINLFINLYDGESNE